MPRCIPLEAHAEDLLNVRQDFTEMLYMGKAKIHAEDLRRNPYKMQPGKSVKNVKSVNLEREKARAHFWDRLGAHEVQNKLACAFKRSNNRMRAHPRPRFPLFFESGLFSY